MRHIVAGHLLLVACGSTPKRSDRFYGAISLHIINMHSWGLTVGDV
jgi:hypothetical protein